MDTTKIILLGVIIGGAVLFGASFLDGDNQPIIQLGGNPISGSSAMGSNLTKSVAVTSTIVLAENSGAQLRIISNVGPADVWLSATTTNLQRNYGFWLKASTTQVFSGDSLYTGALYGTSTATEAILSIFQL